MEPKPRPRSPYLEMPKHIGDVSVGDLLATARHHRVLSEKDSSTVYEKGENAKIAGHALAEAMLIYDDPDQSRTAYRLEQLDAARDLLAIAADAEYAKLEAGHKGADDTADWIRAQLAVDFIAIYGCIVTGNVTHPATGKIISTLQRHLASIKRTRGAGHIDGLTLRHLRGVEAELIVLLDTWTQYKDQGGGTIAIPATYRGGHGSSRPRDTHDVVYLTRTDEATFLVTDRTEVKTEGAIARQPQSLGRYVAALSIVNHSGEVRKLA